MIIPHFAAITVGEGIGVAHQREGVFYIGWSRSTSKDCLLPQSTPSLHSVIYSRGPGEQPIYLPRKRLLPDSSKAMSSCDLICRGEYKPWVNCPMYSLNSQFSIGVILANCWVGCWHFLSQRRWVMFTCIHRCVGPFKEQQEWFIRFFFFFLWGKGISGNHGISVLWGGGGCTCRYICFCLAVAQGSDLGGLR